jgi:predicted metal-dependent hydrolase
MESIITSVITGVLALVGVIISNIASNRKIEAELMKNQAVTETKLEELAREVRTHNSFVTRVPLLEQKVEHLEREVNRIIDK